jgi:hypothetical protein
MKTRTQGAISGNAVSTQFTVNGTRGQMKIQQMAFMLIALAIFFIMVGLFVVSYSFSGLKEAKEDLLEKNAIRLVSKLANSPEFSCENAFGRDRVSCIDVDKVMSLKLVSAEYQNFWGVSNIEIRKTYPEGSSEIECTSLNYPNCGYVKIISKNSGGFDYSTFVSLCRKADFFGTFYDKCEMGKLIVRFSEDEK